ncbi:MAG TPA: DUF202 domain-containing protein [Sphingomicrobium sp.]|nr:DUF202 domain-containing protein [Sphingomicrobium sp.]
MERTDLAEDRTLMAVERTMASWTSAAFAAIGVGLGLHALFARIEPPWMPRVIATIFMALGIIMVISAERRMCRAIARLSAHQIQPPTRSGLRLSAYGVAFAAIVLIGAVWLFYD